MPSREHSSAGHVEYTLTRELGGTRVRVGLTVEPTILLPGFLIRHGSEKVMTALTDGLRKRISGL